ncbi:MAG: translation initiation factor IF-2 subunit beta [Thermoplasmata archaeon]|nr:translation initiation factor IF-2 subunit beta [Thermoplasmata archaeon]
MTEDEYEKLLERAYMNMPQTKGTGERFVVPKADVMVEGKNTIFRNFFEIVEVIRRTPEHFLAYLLKELGTPGEIKEKRVIFKSKISPQMLNERIETYVNTYVICSECGRPDTKLVKEDRIWMLECEACGARAPVTASKSAKPKQEKFELKQGETYEFKIEEIGKKGDGVARIPPYIIYIYGAKAPGEIVRARVTKIAGTVVFATRI